MPYTTFNRSQIFTLTESLTTSADHYFDPCTLFTELVHQNPQAPYLLFESASTDDQRALKSLIITQSALTITALKSRVTVRAMTTLGEYLLAYLQEIFKSELIHFQDQEAIFDLPFDASFRPRGVLTILDPLLALKNPEFSPFIGGLLGYDLVGDVYQITIPEAGRERDLSLYLAEGLITVDHQTKESRYEALFLSEITTRLESYKSFNQHLKHYQTILDRVSHHTDFPTVSPELSTGDHKIQTDLTDKKENLNEYSSLSKGSTQGYAQSYHQQYSQSYPQADGDMRNVMDPEKGVQIPDREPFKAIVESYIEQIHAGKLAQIVPSRTFTVPCPDPLSSYRALKTAYPSPYLFYLHDPEFTLFGASPESSLKYDPKSRELELYPIAGTKLRGMINGEIDEALDQLAEETLINDPKERSEHLMLVDLAEEDLALVSDPETIAVKALMKVDRYRYVMHLVSQVVGRLRDDLSPIDAYLAVMNMGTLTGAPKRYAMEEIYRYEQVARGSFGGAIGYIQATMEGEYFDSAIVIRSAYVADGIAKVQAGAGIVAESNPDREADETENKASSVIMAILQAQSMEQVV